MNLEEIMDTKEAAKTLGMKEAELRSLADSLGVKPVKVLGRLAWTKETISTIKSMAKAKEHGLCPSCGKRVPYVKVKAHDAE